MQAAIENLKSKIYGGVLPAMATPIDPETHSYTGHGLNKLIDFLVAAGVQGLFIGGTTGEGILMSLEERQNLHQQAIKALSGRVPALIHVGANTTTESITLAHHAADAGADAIVAVTPYFYPFHDDGLFDYFFTIAEVSASTPFFVYDIPQMAVNGISPNLVRRLSAEIPTFAGLKSSNGDAQSVRRLIDATPTNKIFLVGNEAIALGTIALGADGMISGLSTAVPEPFVKMVSAFFSGNIHLARHQQQKINEILPLLPPGARIGAIKRLLQQRGILVGPPIPPRPKAPEDWPGWRLISKMID